MTQDEIIRMAREAGLQEVVWQSKDSGQMIVKDMNVPALERFAALVAAHEREACAKVCDTEDVHRGNWYAAAIRARGENNAS